MFSRGNKPKRDTWEVDLSYFECKFQGIGPPFPPPLRIIQGQPIDYLHRNEGSQLKKKTLFEIILWKHSSSCCSKPITHKKLITSSELRTKYSGKQMLKKEGGERSAWLMQVNQPEPTRWSRSENQVNKRDDKICQWREKEALRNWKIILKACLAFKTLLHLH